MQKKMHGLKGAKNAQANQHSCKTKNLAKGGIYTSKITSKMYCQSDTRPNTLGLIN